MNKFIITMLSVCALATLSFAQQADIPSAKPGVQYGKKIDANDAISVKELETSLSKTENYKGKVQGEVLQVCKKKGCFITLKTEGDRDPITVRFTDYAYFMPQDIVGKTVVLEGSARIKETSVDMLKHTAEDLGKSKEEIAAITQPKKDITFMADGVVVVK